MTEEVPKSGTLKGGSKWSVRSGKYAKMWQFGCCSRCFPGSVMLFHAGRIRKWKVEGSQTVEATAHSRVWSMRVFSKGGLAVDGLSHESKVKKPSGEAPNTSSSGCRVK